MAKRMYQKIWDAIKASKVGDQTSVRIHRTAEARLIQAVKKEKTIETAQKKKLGMPFAGPLAIEVIADKNSEEHVIINFSLEWDGNKL